MWGEGRGFVRGIWSGRGGGGVLGPPMIFVIYLGQSLQARELTLQMLQHQAVAGVFFPPDCPSFSVAEIPRIDPETNRAAGRFRFAVTHPRSRAVLELSFQPLGVFDRTRPPQPFARVRLDAEEVEFRPTPAQFAGLSLGGRVFGRVETPQECAVGPVLLALIESPALGKVFAPGLPFFRMRSAARLQEGRGGLLGFGLLPLPELPLVATIRRGGGVVPGVQARMAEICPAARGGTFAGLREVPGPAGVPGTRFNRPGCGCR